MHKSIPHRTWQNLLIAVLITYMVFVYTQMLIDLPTGSALIPYLQAHGYQLYDDIILQYPPFLFAIGTALTHIFENPDFRFRFPDLILSISIVCMVYKVGQREFGGNTGVIAAVFCALWQPSLSRPAPFYFEHVIAFLTLLAFWYRRFPVIAGILLMLAIMTKPQAILLWSLFALWYIHKKHVLTFFVSSILVLLVLLAMYASRLNQLFFWIIKFNFTVYRNQGASSISIIEWGTFLAYISPALPALIHLKQSRSVLGISSLAFTSLVFMYPRPDYVHFSASVPFIALLVGVAWNYSNSSSRIAFSSVHVNSRTSK